MQPQSLRSTSTVLLHTVWFFSQLWEISLPGTNLFSASSSSPATVTASSPVINLSWTQGQVTIFRLLLHHPAVDSISMDCSPSISNETFSSYPWKRSEELPLLLTVFIDISIFFTSCTSHPHILFKVIFHCWIVFIFLDTHWSPSSHPVFFHKTYLLCSIFKGLWKMHSPRLPVPRSHTRSLSLCTCNGKMAGTWSRSFCHISEPVKKERLFWKLVLNRRLQLFIRDLLQQQLHLQWTPM